MVRMSRINSRLRVRVLRNTVSSQSGARYFTR